MSVCHLYILTSRWSASDVEHSFHYFQDVVEDFIAISDFSDRVYVDVSFVVHLFQGADNIYISIFSISKQQRQYYRTKGVRLWILHNTVGSIQILLLGCIVLRIFPHPTLYRPSPITKRDNSIGSLISNGPNLRYERNT